MNEKEGSVPRQLFMQDIKSDIWIPGEVPSSKNSKQIKSKFALKSSYYLKMQGRMQPVHLTLEMSDFAKNYTLLSRRHYINNRKKFLSLIEGLQPPYDVEFTFYRLTKRYFDYNNIGQMVQDMMVKHEWIEDDNCNFLKPFYGDRVIDAVNPGVVIRVLKNKI